jgi:hypothetical protein
MYSMNLGYNILLASLDLDAALSDFATLVGLILTLVTLFTAQRDTEVRTLELGTKTTEAIQRLTREIWLNRGLAVVTALLFASGLPLYVRVAGDFTTSSNHSIRWGFLIVWPLLLPLALWQLRIAERARTAKPRTVSRRVDSGE